MCERDDPYMPGSYRLGIGHNGETCGTALWNWKREKTEF